MKFYGKERWKEARRTKGRDGTARGMAREGERKRGTPYRISVHGHRQEALFVRQ